LGLVGVAPLSIGIEPSHLADRLVGREFAYLVTAGSERSHVVALRCEVSGDRVTMSGAGRSASANIAANARVTLVWPPTPHDVENRNYSVIADGLASMNGDDVVVVIGSAVFHRPA